MKKTAQTRAIIATVTAAWLISFLLADQANYLVSFAMLPIVFFLPGYLFLKTIWGRTPRLSYPEAILLSIALSFIFAYPICFSNNIFEYLTGNEPFQVHRDSFLIIYAAVIAILYLLSHKKKPFHSRPKKNHKLFCALILTIFIAALAARLFNLPFQNINGDEQELSLYAYHLVDGIFAGRNALFLSQSGHSPLGFYVSHLIYQTLNPTDYASLTEWMIRLPMIIFGLLELAIFLLFAKRLNFSRLATVLGLLLLTVNTYAIFGSRLMIPQDGSVFTFFVLLFVYFFVTLLEEEKLTRTHLLILSLLFAATFLVKFSAILLIPPVLLYWFLRKKPLKSLLASTGLTLLFFSPVIAFNIGAYIKTGYTDVPFAKVFNFLGIPAESIMGNQDLYSSAFPPFLKTLLGFLQMLADQWSPEFMLSLVAAVILLMINKKFIPRGKHLIGFFFLLFALTTLFFSLNGYRAYYAEFLTVPAILLIITATGTLFARKKWYFTVPATVWLVLLPISCTSYTLNTHWLVSDPPPGLVEYGRDHLYTAEELETPFSLASAAFLKDEGFPALRAALADTTTPLIIDDSLLDNYLHHFRWYLHIHRDVEQYYLGESYQDAYTYSRLSESEPNQPGLYIFPYEKATLQEGDEVLKNHLGAPKMILREV
ncbi:glycosyltransferase family 39 protein [Patescibacteria group bacterium]|nr:glycosyltransferase family 39 protein [Patescibacteria group bacterium]